MTSNFTPAMTRGISDNVLYETAQLPDYAADFFHQGDMDGAYQDEVTWEGLGLPVEHYPLQRVNFDGIRPSWQIRYLARSWTLGVVIPLEDQQDDLYGIIHKFFPMTGGEFARSYYALKQILAAQFFGLYGFQTGTSVPFAPDGVSFFNTAHQLSQSNTTTYSNTLSTAADLSYTTAVIMKAAMRTQKTPNGFIPIPNRVKRVMVHPTQEVIARLVFEYGKELYDRTNRAKNFVADDNVEVCVNPFWEYSGSTGTATNAFNSWFGQGETHYCKWLNRSAFKTYSHFDNTIFADIITCMERFAYGLTDARGLFGSRGV